MYLHNETANEPDRDKRIYTITWDSSTKKPGEARLLLRDCSLFLGLGHGQFAKRVDMQKMWAGQAAKAWSVVGAVRSLDLVCMTEFDFEEWMAVLRRIPMKAKALPRKRGTVSISAEGRLEGEEEEKGKVVRPAASTSQLAAGSVNSSTSAIGKAGGEGKKQPAMSRLQQARQERAAKGEGPAGSRLAALLKNAGPGPAVDLDSDDDDAPPPARKKK